MPNCSMFYFFFFFLFLRIAIDTPNTQRNDSCTTNNLVLLVLLRREPVRIYCVLNTVITIIITIIVIIAVVASPPYSTTYVLIQRSKPCSVHSAFLRKADRWPRKGLADTRRSQDHAFTPCDHETSFLHNTQPALNVVSSTGQIRQKIRYGLHLSRFSGPCG